MTGSACGRAQSSVAASGTTSSGSPWITRVSARHRGHLLLLVDGADQHQALRLRIARPGAPRPRAAT